MATRHQHRLDQLRKFIRHIVSYVSEAGVRTIKGDLRNAVVDTLAGGIDQVYSVASGAGCSSECCGDIRHMYVKPVSVEGGSFDSFATFHKIDELGGLACCGTIDIEVFGHGQPRTLAEVGVLVEAISHDFGRRLTPDRGVKMMFIAKP